MVIDTSREPKHESFGTFLYNSAEGTVLGRTGASWGKIGFFYLIFYSFLAAWFAVMLTIFYQTLDTVKQPTYYPGDGGSILQNIAMGYRPLAPRHNIESTLIWYNQSQWNETDKIRKTTTEHWINDLNETVKPYSVKVEGTEYIECNQDTKPDDSKQQVCNFDIKTQFQSHCQPDNKWGYLSGQPCVLLKLNKMIKWVPDVYKNMTDVEKAVKKDDMPKELATHIEEETKTKGFMPQLIWVSCYGKYPPDQDEIGELQYFPQRGFDIKYFPFTNTPGYRAPLVAVKFVNPPKQLVLNIECRAWAKNIKQSRYERFGLIDFELLIDQAKPAVKAPAAPVEKTEGAASK